MTEYLLKMLSFKTLLLPVVFGAISHVLQAQMPLEKQQYASGRDGIKKRTLEEISQERRNGYNWYTSGPQRVIERYPEWKGKWVMLISGQY